MSRSASARQQGIDVDSLNEGEPPNAPEAWLAAWRFADSLGRDARTIGPEHYASLFRHFSPAEVAEIVAFCAWQYGGVRMTDSLGAHRYPRTVPARQDDFPVRLPYFHGEQRDPPVGTVGPFNRRSCEQIVDRARRDGAPPLRWVALLAANERILGDWTHLFWSTTEDGILPLRVTQLVRYRMAQLLGVPEWAPEHSSVVAAVGEARQAVSSGSRDALDAKQRAALAYAEEIATSSEVSDETFDRHVAPYLSLPELIELAYGVACQNGAIRVFLSLRDLSLPPQWPTCTGAPIDA